MYDEAYGLRFDIYERVHLSDECVGIVQLEEVELTPHIQVIPAGDQVTVRGSLLLAGVYQGDDEGRGSQSLEHWIPVEITLPLNRIRSLEDISVDIEHFDVDLLSARSLNITGILSLRGIAMEPAEPSSWEPEQFTVVHQAEEERGSDEPEWLRDYGEEAARTPKPEALDAVARIRSLADGAERREEEWQAIPEPAAAEPVRENTYSEYIDQIDSKAVTAAEAEAEEAEPEQDPGRTELTWNHAPWASASVADSPPAAQKAGAEEEASGAESGQPSEPANRAIDEEEAAEPEAEESAAAGRTGEEPATWNLPQPQSWAASAPEPASAPDPALEAQAEPRTEEKPAEASASVASAAPAAETSAGEASVAETDGAEEQTPAEAKPREEGEAEPVENAAADAKPEMKIAIGSAKPAEAPAASGVGFSSLLQSSRQTKEREQREAETKQAEEEAALEAAKMTSGDDVKWQSLFLQRVNDEQGFKKVRMCIVQREETLDTIADRYQMNSNEIVLYNRLSDQNVTEGQVLYIPVTS